MIIAIEGGGTSTRAGLYDDKGNCLREIVGAPSNPIAYGIVQASQRIASLTVQLCKDVPLKNALLLVGMAGAFDHKISSDLAQSLGDLMDIRTIWVASDLHAMLHANTGDKVGILAISGTGAAVIGRNKRGDIVRVGGWGTLLGDDGSAYAIAVSALRACAAYLDGLGKQTLLVPLLAKAANLREFHQFVAWSKDASKKDIAMFAPVVVQAAEQGDRVARACIQREAQKLAACVIAAHQRLKLSRAARIPVYYYGSVLEHCAIFRTAFERKLCSEGNIKLFPCEKRGHEAVFSLTTLASAPPWVSVWTRGMPKPKPLVSETELTDESPTIDSLTASELVQRMHRADLEAVGAVEAVLPLIATAVEWAAKSIAEGARIIYAGAGTSGRLAVLDASECPPTFGVSPNRVIALIAGGDKALRQSVEGAEDDALQGTQDGMRIHITAKDLVVGIAASGNTPYVQGVLSEAKKRGALTVLITSNPKGGIDADLKIAARTGREVVAGSTRLKAGTAAKMILNMISTGAFALTGSVYQGRMVGMIAANSKLRRRAARMVAELTNVSEGQATKILEQCDYHIPTAIVAAYAGMEWQEAKKVLHRHRGKLHAVIKDLEFRK